MCVSIRYCSCYNKLSLTTLEIYSSLLLGHKTVSLRDSGPGVSSMHYTPHFKWTKINFSSPHVPWQCFFSLQTQSCIINTARPGKTRLISISPMLFETYVHIHIFRYILEIFILFHQYYHYEHRIRPIYRNYFSLSILNRNRNAKNEKKEE